MDVTRDILVEAGNMKRHLGCRAGIPGQRPTWVKAKKNMQGMFVDLQLVQFGWNLLKCPEPSMRMRNEDREKFAARL